MELAVAAAVPPLVLWAAGRSRRRVAEQWAKLGDFQALNDHQAVVARFSKEKETVLLIGSSGFVGVRIQQLHFETYQAPFNLVCVDLGAPKEMREDVVYFTGDVREPKHLKEIYTVMSSYGFPIKGTMHLASIIPFLGIPDSLITRVNVKALEDSVKMAKDQGVSSFVYTSSATCVLDGADDAPVDLDEGSPYPEKNMDTYTSSKVAAERMVCGAHEAKDEAERGEGTSFYTAVLRPSGIIGPGDKVLYDKLKLGEDNVWIQGKPNGESLLDFIGVDAVALGHLKAMSQLLQPNGRLKRPNATIINLSAGKGIEYKKLIGWEVETDSKNYWGHAPARPVPFGVVKCLAYINESWCSFFGKALLSPFLAQVNLNYTQRSYVFSNKRARELLQWEPEDDDIKDTVRKYLRRDPSSKRTN